MFSLIVHALLGLGTIWFIVRLNPAIFRRPPSGPALSTLEIGLYVVGVTSILAGWSFNIAFVVQNTHGFFTNPFVGNGSWQQYLKLMFANPAAGSAGIDFSIANVLLLPLVTIVDGRRRGINRPWLYFVATLFASFTFGWAFYAATVERQRRLAADGLVNATT
ncbi:MAG: hypothetical protein JWR52_3637 [Marmoricola sp.]|nr:hypothetical protein [Marmoricola sp.]